MIAATAKPKSVWQKHRFSDFVHIAPKVTLQQGSDYSFVEMAELHDGNKFCNTSVLRPFNGSGTKFQDSDTLFARITPCLENGKICQVRNLSEGKGFGSTEFHIFRGKEGVSDTEFVYYYPVGLMSGNLQRQISMGLLDVSEFQRKPLILCF